MEADPLLNQDETVNSKAASKALNHTSSKSDSGSRRNSQKGVEQDRALEEVITMEPGQRCPSSTMLHKAFDKDARWDHSGHDHGVDTLKKLTKREKMNRVSQTFCVKFLSCCAGCIEG